MARPDGDFVIGLGEVGRGLVTVLDCPGRDVHPVAYRADTLHIAYPWFDGFIDQTRRYAAEHEATLVVVHSTVPVGTCDPEGWVHSPVRGRHPHLARDLVKFDKFFGGARAGEVSWPGPAVYCTQAAETEAAKLWELAAFGLQVRLCQAVYEYSADRGLSPGVVYRLFGETHNEGVAPHLVKPILDYMPGPIGGHCVAAGMALLDHPLADLLSDDVILR